MKLPPPDADALAHSQALCAVLHQQIAACGGWVSFQTYMQTALYHPGLGYYSAGASKFGPDGDFITAPEITPLFGQAVALQLGDIMAQSAPHILEIGAGTGMLAADILLMLDSIQRLPQSYAILEVSPDLRARQQQCLQTRAPDLLERVVWLDTLPQHFSGAVLANEVLDVMPVQRLLSHQTGVFERGVMMHPEGVEAGFIWSDRPASADLCALAKRYALPQNEAMYVTEVSPLSSGWIASLADMLVCGAIVLIDYGYPGVEFYLPSRDRGTLMCYYRHRGHDDPFLWPGLMDITAFVDFTAIAEAADHAGLSVYGYTSQAQFLLNCGILSLLEKRNPADARSYMNAARAVQRLLSPQEMGELFKVILLGKQLSAQGRGFSSGDRLHVL